MDDWICFGQECIILSWLYTCLGEICVLLDVFLRVLLCFGRGMEIHRRLEECVLCRLD